MYQKTIKKLEEDISLLNEQMQSLKGSMRVVLDDNVTNTFDNDYLRARSITSNDNPATSTSAIHHLYQDLFITDLKRDLTN